MQRNNFGTLDLINSNLSGNVLGINEWNPINAALPQSSLKTSSTNRMYYKGLGTFHSHGCYIQPLSQHIVCGIEERLICSAQKWGWRNFSLVLLQNALTNGRDSCLTTSKSLEREGSFHCFCDPPLNPWTALSWKRTPLKKQNSDSFQWIFLWDGSRKRKESAM